MGEREVAVSRLRPIQHDPDATHKEYLGDGLYVRVLDDTIWLTSENGVEVLDAVALEPRVLDAFARYIERFKK